MSDWQPSPLWMVFCPSPRGQPKRILPDNLGLSTRSANNLSRRKEETMELMTSKQSSSLTKTESDANRRQSSRVAGAYGLTFSGVDGNRFMMGDGSVMDLSDEGIGVLSDRPVRAGMDLAILIELPDS